MSIGHFVVPDFDLAEIEASDPSLGKFRINKKEEGHYVLYDRQVPVKFVIAGVSEAIQQNVDNTFEMINVKIMLLG